MLPTNIIAISYEGLCFYFDVLRTITHLPHRLRMLHVVQVISKGTGEYMSKSKMLSRTLGVESPLTL